VHANIDWAFVMQTASNLSIHDGAAWRPMGEVIVMHGRLRYLAQHSLYPTRRIKGQFSGVVGTGV